MSGDPIPYEHLLTPVDGARDGRWYIILHRRVDSTQTRAMVDQFCTPSADGRGLHYYDLPHAGRPAEMSDHLENATMTTKPATHQIISTSRVDEPPPSPGSGDVWQVLVWRAYQVLHPRAGDEPTARDGKLITWCLAELHRTRKLTPEACGELLIDLLRCFHLAPETAFWRGGDGKARLGIGTLCKREKFGDRVETTLAWVEGGRPEQEAQPDYASAERAKKAIGWVWSRIDSGSTGFPEGMTAKIGEAGARAYAAGIEAIGGWDHASRTPAARRAGPTAAFTAAFIASLQGDT